MTKQKHTPMQFILQGNTTVFTLVKRYEAAGFIPSVIGHTLDGKRQTAARVADIIWLEG